MSYKCTIDLYLLLKIILPPIKPKIFIAMKKLNVIYVTILSFMLVSVSQAQKKLSLTKVFVESGKVTTVGSVMKFSLGKPFDPIHTAIGTIDTAVCKPNSYNGYADTNDMVYVFAGGKIPTKVNVATLPQKLQTARWTTDFIYKLPLDAEFCMDFSKFQYYIREAGETPRQKTVLMPENITVYRFKNVTYLEDYGKYAKAHTHLFLARQITPISYFGAVGVSSANYNVTSKFPNLKLTSTGLIDFVTSTATDTGRTDKIYLLPKSGIGQKYRFRVVYLKHNTQSRNSNFPQGEKATFKVLDKQKLAWTNTLKNSIIPKYLEKTIRGYNCVKCKPASNKLFILGGAAGEITPPLPIVENGIN